MSEQGGVVEPDELVGGLNLSVLDFWRWGFSDVSKSRELQAVVGSFLVAAALGVDDTPRDPSGPGHLAYGDRTIATATSRTWQDGRRPDDVGPVFAVPAPKRWDDLRRRVIEHPRSADCYVFCLLTTEEPQPSTDQVLDAFEWRFWAMPTPVLEREVGPDSQIGADRLREHTDSVDYFGLQESVNRALMAVAEGAGQPL